MIRFSADSAGHVHVPMLTIQGGPVTLHLSAEHTPGSPNPFHAGG